MRKLFLAEEQQFGKIPQSEQDNYGQEIIMDMHNCDPDTFTNESIESFLQNICDATDMKRAELHWWEDTAKQEEYDEENNPHLAGISCVQFIQTSSIVIHTIIPWKKIFINFFTCKTFDSNKAKAIMQQHFKGEIVTFYNIVRK